MERPGRAQPPIAIHRQVFCCRNALKSRDIRIQITVIVNLQHSILHVSIQRAKIDNLPVFESGSPASERCQDIVVPMPVGVVALSIQLGIFGFGERIRMQPV